MHVPAKAIGAGAAAPAPYWATVQLLDGSEVSGVVTEETHAGVCLYRVERRSADGSPMVEYYGFISISCMAPGDHSRAPRGTRTTPLHA